MTSGYSGTPLISKLGIKAGFDCLVINAPVDYFAWLGALPEGASFEKVTEAYDMIHWFIRHSEDVHDQLAPVIRQMKPGGMLWVS